MATIRLGKIMVTVPNGTSGPPTVPVNTLVGVGGMIVPVVCVAGRLALGEGVKPVGVTATVRVAPGGGYPGTVSVMPGGG